MRCGVNSGWLLRKNGRHRRTLGKRKRFGDALATSRMGNEAHDCEELSGIESILGAQSGVKEFEDLRTR